MSPPIEKSSNIKSFLSLIFVNLHIKTNAISETRKPKLCNIQHLNDKKKCNFIYTTDPVYTTTNKDEYYFSKPLTFKSFSSDLIIYDNKKENKIGTKKESNNNKNIILSNYELGNLKINSPTKVTCTSTPSSPIAEKRRAPHKFSFFYRLFSKSRKNFLLSNKTNPKMPTTYTKTKQPSSTQSTPVQQQLTFSQRIKLHKGLRTGKIPVELLTQKVLLQKENQQKRQLKIASKTKENSLKNQIAETNQAFLFDSKEINTTLYLTEALLAIADSQPLVARSTPKHALMIDKNFSASKSVTDQKNKRKAEEQNLQDCLFKSDIYDQMLADSLLVCDLLQEHLTNCIVGVRARSPTVLSSPFTSPPATPILSQSRSLQPLHSQKQNFSMTSINQISKLNESNVLNPPFRRVNFPTKYSYYNLDLLKIGSNDFVFLSDKKVAIRGNSSVLTGKHTPDTLENYDDSKTNNLRI